MSGNRRQAGPSYWLGVCDGVTAAHVFAAASTGDEINFALTRYPILGLPEFADAMRALARLPREEGGDPGFAVEARELERIHAAVPPDMKSQLLNICAAQISESPDGDRRVNLARAAELQRRARELVSANGPALWAARMALNESLNRWRLAELGVDPLDNLEEARRCTLTARDLAPDGTPEHAVTFHSEANLCQSFADLGHDVVPHLERAITLFSEAESRLPRRHPDHATAVMNRGNAHMRLAAHVQHGRRHLEQARETLAAALDLLPPGSRNHGRCLMNLGNVLQDIAVEHSREPLPLLRDALDLYRRAGESLSKTGPAVSVAKALMGRGHVRLRLSEAGETPEEHLRAALALHRRARELLPEGSTPVAACLVDEANALSGLAGLGVDPIASLRQARALYARARQERGASPDERSVCALGEANALARASVYVPERDQALEQAEALFCEAAGAVEEGTAAHVAALLNHGAALLNAPRFPASPLAVDVGRLERAAALCREARRWLDPSRTDYAWSLSTEAGARGSLADLFVRPAENLVEALRLHGEARPLQAAGSRGETLARFGEAVTRFRLDRLREDPAALRRSLDELGEVGALCEARGMLPEAVVAFVNQGRAAERVGEVPGAHRAFVRAVDLCEVVRDLTLSLHHRRQWQERHHLAYSGAIRTAMALGDVVTAAELCEQSRARTLSDLIAERRPLPAGCPAELAQRYRALRRELSLVERQAEQLGAFGPPDPGAEALLRRRRELADTFVEVRDEVWAVDHAGSAGAERLTVARMAGVAARLGCPLVSFWVGEEAGAAFVVRPEGTLDAVDLPGLCQRWIDDKLHGEGGWLAAGAQESGGAPSDRMEALDRLLPAVRDVVMEPVLRSLGADGPGRAVLVAGGGLSVMPLAAAVDVAGHAREGNWAICRAPSVRALMRCVEERAGPSPRAVLAASDAAELPWAFREVEAVRGLVGGSPHLEARVFSGTTTEELFEAGESARLLHMACHGCWRPEAPLESALSLSGLSLSVRDLFEHRGPAPAWVVLSACETALGTEVRARSEEYLGIPAGFMLAGSRVVMGTLWHADDLATTLLMRRFYGELCRGAAALAALAATRRWARSASRDDLREELRRVLPHQQELAALAAETLPRGDNPLAHPWFWAGLELFGDPTARLVWPREAAPT